MEVTWEFPPLSEPSCRTRRSAPQGWMSCLGSMPLQGRCPLRSRDRPYGWFPTMGLAPCWGSASQAPPVPFPHARAWGCSSLGCFFIFGGAGGGGKRSNRGPQAQEKPLGGHQAWTRAAPALGGCSHLDTWDGKAQAPISFKKRSKKPKTKKGTTMTYNAVSIPIIHISEPR